MVVPSSLLILEIFFLLRIAFACDNDFCMDTELPESKKIENSTLVGHVFKTVNKSSFFNCLLECSMDCKCVSINLHRQNKTCELNHASNTSHPSAVVKKKGWSYYGIMIKTQRKVSVYSRTFLIAT